VKPTPIGARLRAARIRARYSLDEVARYAHVSKPKVVSWEADKAPPSEAEAARLARVLGLSPAALFGETALVAMGHDPAAVAQLAAAAPTGARPRQKLRGHDKPEGTRLPVRRCGGCGRWVGDLRCGRCFGPPAEIAPSAGQGSPAIGFSREHGETPPPNPDRPLRPPVAVLPNPR
jgi:transcriptional regulator with XRE-family HTH domain